MYVEELADKREWEDFLRLSPDGTFFHSLQWKEVVEKSFHDSPIYLTVKDANGIVGICPGFIQSSMHTKIYSSMPYSDYGGPVITRHSIEQASLSLRHYLQRFCSRIGIAYLRVSFKDGNEKFFGSPLGYIDTSQGTVDVELEATPSHFIWDKVFSGERRKKIRRLERAGYQARQARTRSDLRDFYSLYRDNMKYLGAHPYPFEFLENMWTLLYPENLRIWLVAREKAIGGTLVLRDERRTYGFLGGLDRGRVHNHPVIGYLLWKEVETAEEEGCRYVSFGSTANDPNNPYYLQKISYGGVFHHQKIVRYPCSYIGQVLLQARATAFWSGRIVRRFLPRHLTNRLRDYGKRFGS